MTAATLRAFRVRALADSYERAAIGALIQGASLADVRKLARRAAQYRARVRRV